MKERGTSKAERWGFNSKQRKKKTFYLFIDNVTFAYDNRQTALNGISFTIPKGATVALVGPSGGG
jgi:ATP-binding cassette subfamily B (MDR/TAP) protein 6